MSATDRPVPRPPATPTCFWCGSAVDLPQPGWKGGKHAVYCTKHHRVASRDPNKVVAGALADAGGDLDIDTSRLPTWPWLSLQEMAGPIGPGQIIYLAAFAGNGKTSVIAHCQKHWLAQGLRVFHMPLEATPQEWMARMVCLELGLNPDDVLSHRMLYRAEAGDVWAQANREALRARYLQIREDPGPYSGLVVEPSDTLSAAQFSESCEAAHDMDCDLVVVDHVDHVGHVEGGSTNGFEVSTSIQHAAKRFARNRRIPCILLSQLNSKATGGDALAHYRPPLSDWLWMKGVKDQIATLIMGIYRPMRDDLDDGFHRELRQGRKTAADIAAPNRIAFNLMKGRYHGSAKDRSIQLHYEHGLITDLTTPERLDHAADQHGISTRPPGAPRPGDF